MANDARRLAQEIADLRRRLEAMERSSQLHYSSIEGGSLEINDDDGNPRSIVGQQADGTYTWRDVNAPPPEPPSTPLLASKPGLLVVTWDGRQADGDATLPFDFARVEIHLDTIPDFTPAAATQVATFDSPRRGEVALALDPGTYYVRLVMVNTSGAESQPSDTASGSPGKAEFGEGGAQTFHTATPPVGLDADDEGALWYDSDNGNLQHRWDGTDWVPMPVGTEGLADGAVTTVKIGDQAVDVGQLADGAVSASKIVSGAVTPDKASFYGEVTTAQATAEDAATAASAAQSDASQAIQDADAAAQAAAAAQSDADAAASAAAAAQADATQAQQDADAAETKALEALGVAESKADIVYQSAAPAGDPSVYWVDTDTGRGHRWDGSTWVEIQDEDIQTALSNAAAADAKAVQAQQDADAAASAAAAAQSDANAAQSDATQALSDAAAAQADASQALADAGDAAGAAAAAQDAADLAQQTANSAESTANQAVSDASAAQSTANQALSDANNITSTQITDGAVTTPKVTAGAITAAKIAADAVTADKILAGSVTTAKIDAGAITSGKIAADAVTAGSIAADAVTAGTIAAGAVTAGTVAANVIGADQLVAGAVTAGKIAADAVEANTIASGAVTSAKVAAGAITAGKINTGAVTSSKIDADAVTADKIAAGEVQAQHIAANAVQADAIQANAIDGMTITGAYIQTSHDAYSGIKIDGPDNSIHIYDMTNTGNELFAVDTYNGQVRMVGTFYSNNDAQPRVQIAPPLGFAGASIDFQEPEPLHYDGFIGLSATYDIHNSDLTLSSGYWDGHGDARITLSADWDSDSDSYISLWADQVQIGKFGEPIRGIRWGSGYVNTDSTGKGTFFHNMGVTPKVVLLQIASHYDIPTSIQEYSRDSNQITVSMIRSDNGNWVVAGRTIFWVCIA